MRTGQSSKTLAPTRRELLKGFGFAFGSAALLPQVLQTASAQAQPARPAADIIMRAIPRTGERVPAIGLGTFITFDTIPGQPREPLREVMKRFWEGGGRVIDTSPLYGTGETTVGDFATSLGITRDMFVTNKVWSTGDFLADASHAERSFEASTQRLWRDKIDVMQCHSLVNVDIIIPLLKAWKKEGRIRYIGLSHHEISYMGLLANWVERGDLDFVQVNYSIATRVAEERLLPAAADKGTGVLVNMPFEKARLFKVVEGRPLPDFAKEIDAKIWAAFFLKWVISNPAVTCAIPATSNPDHMAENIAALRGPLPDREMRARMVRHMETIPGFDKLAQMPWYPDKKYPGIIARAQMQLRARS